jgi:hypothetical protein
MIVEDERDSYQLHLDTTYEVVELADQLKDLTMDQLMDLPESKRSMI